TLPAPGADPMRFAGQERDATGLDYMGARYYNMHTGRFTSVDPVLDPTARERTQRWQRYAYGLSGPLRFADPTGLDAEEDGGGKIHCPLGGNGNGCLSQDNGFLSVFIPERDQFAETLIQESNPAMVDPRNPVVVTCANCQGLGPGLVSTGSTVAGIVDAKI